MAKYEEPKITVSLDDESKELLKRIADALERQSPDTERSFADAPKRLVEPFHLAGTPYDTIHATNRDGAMPNVGTPIQTVEYGGQKYGLYYNGEGDYLLHDDGHEGEELE